MKRAPLIASAGAGISLVVAGVLVMVVASGVVAFKGWPGQRAVADVTKPVRLAAVASAGADGVGAEVSAPAIRLAAPAAARSGRRSARSRRGRRAQAGSGVAGEFAEARARARAEARDLAAQVPTGRTSPVTEPSAAAPSLPSLPPAPDQRGTKETVHELVEPVLEVASPVVDEVEKTVDGLLAPPAP